MCDEEEEEDEEASWGRGWRGFDTFFSEFVSFRFWDNRLFRKERNGLACRGPVICVNRGLV